MVIKLLQLSGLFISILAKQYPLVISEVPLQGAWEAHNHVNTRECQSNMVLIHCCSVRRSRHNDEGFDGGEGDGHILKHDACNCWSPSGWTAVTAGVDVLVAFTWVKAAWVEGKTLGICVRVSEHAAVRKELMKQKKIIKDYMQSSVVWITLNEIMGHLHQITVPTLPLHPFFLSSSLNQIC